MTSERKTPGALSAPPPPAGDVMSALIQAYENKIADLERERGEAWARAGFAEDQLDVALKDRDHAEREKDMLVAHVDILERELKEARTEIERLNNHVADWSKANLAIVAKCVEETKRADHAEGQLGAEHAAHLATGRWLADVEQQLTASGGPGHDEK